MFNIDNLTIKKIENEIAIQELEKKLKEKELKRVAILEPQKVAILVAIIGLIGIAVTNWLQRNSQLLIEEKKFQYSVYQKALESKDKVTAAKILDFYIKANLLPGENGKYSKLLQEGNVDAIPIYSETNKSIDLLHADSLHQVETRFVDSVQKANFGRIKQ